MAESALQQGAVNCVCRHRRDIHDENGICLKIEFGVPCGCVRFLSESDAEKAREKRLKDPWNRKKLKLVREQKPALDPGTDRETSVGDLGETAIPATSTKAIEPIQPKKEPVKEDKKQTGIDAWM